MNLGAGAVSRPGEDIQASRVVSAKVGVEESGGDADDNWLILRNGDHVIGLFQGMFEKNMLTFNPGWDQQCNNLDTFTDVRELQRSIRDQGVEIGVEADESGEGPASFMITDPDGNPILFDQHR